MMNILPWIMILMDLVHKVTIWNEGALFPCLVLLFEGEDLGGGMFIAQSAYGLALRLA